MKVKNKYWSNGLSAGRIILGVAICVAPLTATSGDGANYDDRWYFAPGLSYIIADDDRKADDNFGFKLSGGKPVHKNWNIEVSGLYDDLDTGNSEYKQRGLLIDGLFFMNRQQKLPVYGVIGAGAMRTKLAGDSSTNPLANVGLGLSYEFSKIDMKLRSDIRYRLDNDDSSVASEDRFGDWVLNLGLMIPLGKKAEPLAAAALIPAVMTEESSTAEETKLVIAPKPDSDADGISDDMDLCQNTKTGVKIDAKGCELDSDGDMVADSLDQCAESKSGVQVDARGCEIVKESIAAFETAPAPVVNVSEQINKMDCRDMSPEKIINTFDCSLHDVVSTQSYEFDSASAELTADTQLKLKALADRLILHPTETITVLGHTDSQGSYKMNQQLSIQRAANVRQFLLDQGVDANMLTTRGLGSDMPVADNSNEQGRAKNRRVEMLVSE